MAKTWKKKETGEKDEPLIDWLIDWLIDSQYLLSNEFLAQKFPSLKHEGNVVNGSELSLRLLGSSGTFAFHGSHPKVPQSAQWMKNSKEESKKNATYFGGRTPEMKIFLVWPEASLTVMESALLISITYDEKSRKSWKNKNDTFISECKSVSYSMRIWSSFLLWPSNACLHRECCSEWARNFSISESSSPLLRYRK